VILGYDAVYCAAWVGNSHALDMMLEELQNEPNTRPISISEIFSPIGPNGRNPIHAAAINGHLNCLQTLISQLLISNIPPNKLLFR